VGLENSGETSHISGALVVEDEIVPEFVNVNFGGAIDEEEEDGLKVVLVG